MFGFSRSVLIGVAVGGVTFSASLIATPPFRKDVLPDLQKTARSVHRPG